MVKAISYIRMSTTQQLSGDSLRRQTEQARTYAQKHGLELDETFKLTDIGYSAFDGSNLEKGALGQLLKLVQDGRLERGTVLLVESFDRLSRQDVKKALTLFLNLLNAGITIVTLVDEKVYTPESNEPVELVVTIMLMARANEESTIKAFRVKKAWDKKRQVAGTKKMTALCPSWLKLIGNSFTVIEHRAAVVRQIFHDCVELGLGAYAITRRLNHSKIPPFSLRSNHWSTSTVKKILHSRAVLGEFQPHEKREGRRIPSGPVREAYFPSIISPELFNQAQQRMRERENGGGGRHGTKISNLFTGLMTCPYCGNAVRMITKERKLLVCSAAHQGTGCFTVYWKYDELERLVLTYLRDLDHASLIGTASTASELQEVRRKILTESGRLGDMKGRRDKVFELAVANDTSNYFKQQLLRLENDVVESESALTELMEHESTLGARDAAQSMSGRDIAQLIARLQNADDPDVHALRARVRTALRDIVERIFPYFGGQSIDFENAVLSSNTRNQLLHDFGQVTALGKTTSQPNPSKRSLSIILKNGKQWLIQPDPKAPHQIRSVLDPAGFTIAHFEVMGYVETLNLDPNDPADYALAYEKARQQVLEERGEQHIPASE